MFTQCPECVIGFRVTAKVLQQAHGDVRCGNCGHAFNALDYLSEEMPEPPAPKVDANAMDETSQRLLKTLDELAGPEDVRIEDTGVEWRVLEDLPAPEFAAEDTPDDDAAIDDPAEDVERYDDDSPLPDDTAIDAVDEAVVESASETSPAAEVAAAPQASFDPSFDDVNGEEALELGESEDWSDLLDEVSEPTQESSDESEEFDEDEDSDEVEDEILSADRNLEATGLGVGATDDALTDEVPLLSEADFESSDEDDDEESNDEAEVDNDWEDDWDDDDSDDEALHDPRIERADEWQDEEDTAPEHSDDGDGANEDWDDVEDDDDEDDAEVYEDEDEDDVDDDETESKDDEDEDEDEIDEWSEEPADARDWAFTDDEDNENVDESEQDDEPEEDDFRDEDTPPDVKSPQELFDEHADDVETIVMEGDDVLGTLDGDSGAPGTATTYSLNIPAEPETTRSGWLRGGRRSGDPASFKLIAVVSLLALVLGGQYIHFARESLATTELFERTVAPIYRALGRPVTPAWNVNGWRFESTNGRVGNASSALVIDSALRNDADQALPYPLIYVSLTDRFEDIVGSRVLEPADYLAAGFSPDARIAAGESLSAQITVTDPSPRATGFKLNVCYPGPGEDVRCAIEDFKR